MIDRQQLRQGVIASSHPGSSSTDRTTGGSFFTIPQCPFSIPIGPLAAEFDGFALGVNHLVWLLPTLLTVSLHRLRRQQRM